MESNYKSIAVKIYCGCSTFSFEDHISQQAFYKRKQKWPIITQKMHLIYDLRNASLQNNEISILWGLKGSFSQITTENVPF